MSPALGLYIRLLDQLLWARAVRTLDEDEEEFFAVSLNDCRRGMPKDDEAKIPEIIAKRKATVARSSLDLIDAEPSRTGDSPLRTAAA